ncbi:MAG: CHAT domain-containing protein [Methylococcales bacterium]
MAPKLPSCLSEGIEILRARIRDIDQRIEQLLDLAPEKRDWVALGTAWIAISDDPIWSSQCGERPVEALEKLGKRCFAILDGLLATTERDNPEAKVLCLRVYRSLGWALWADDRPGAEAVYREILERSLSYLAEHPDHASMKELLLHLYCNAGGIEHLLGRPDQALKLSRAGLGPVKGFLAANPNHAGLQELLLHLYFKAGVTERELGRPDAALKLYRAGLDHVAGFLAANPDHAGLQEQVLSLYVNAGTVKHELGHRDEALKLFRAGLNHVAGFLAANPDHTGLQEKVVSLYNNAGAAEVQLDRPDEALKLLRTGLDRVEGFLAANPRHAGLQEQVLLLYYNAGVIVGNLGRLNQALKLYRAGLEYVEWFLAANPDHADLQEQVLCLYYNAGFTEGRLGRRDEALNLYRAGLYHVAGFHAANPRHAGLQDQVLGLYYNAGVTEDQLGRRDEALNLYRAGLDYVAGVLAANPDHAGLQIRVLKLYNNAGVTEGRLGRRDEALKLFRVGLNHVAGFLAANPGHAGLQEQVVNLYVNAGGAEGQLGHPDEALKLLRAGLDQVEGFLAANPGHAGLQEQVVNLYVNAGVTEGQLGHRDDALKLFRTGILLGARFFQIHAIRLAQSSAESLFKLHRNLIAVSIGTFRWRLLLRQFAITPFADSPPESDMESLFHACRKFTCYQRPDSYGLTLGFHEHLLDWVLNWRPADDALGINARLLDSCRATEVLWLLERARENGEFQGLIKEIANFEHNLQTQYDAWNDEKQRVAQPLWQKLDKARRRLGISSDEPADLERELDQRSRWWQRWKDRGTRRAIAHWYMFEAQFEHPPDLSAQEVARFKRTMRSIVKWLTGALQRHHGFPDELQYESEVLLAFVLAAQDANESISPDRWGQTQSLHTLMSRSGWERWTIRDDGTRPTLSIWEMSVRTAGIRISYALGNTAAPELDRALRGYAVALRDDLDASPDFATSFPGDYVRKVRAQAALGQRRPEKANPAGPALDDEIRGETESLTRLLDQAWYSARRTALDLARLLAAFEDGASLRKQPVSEATLNAVRAGEPPGRHYPEALRAIIMGQIPALLTRHVEAWLNRVNPVSEDLGWPEARRALKRAFSRVIGRHPGPDADAQLSLRLHNYCRNFLAESLRAETPDPDAIWETLERGRLALCGLQVKPLPDKALETTGKRLNVALDQLDIVAGKDCFTPLLHAWLAGIEEYRFVPKKPACEDCRSKLKNGEALVQPFFDPDSGRLRALWLDAKAFNLRSFDAVELYRERWCESHSRGHGDAPPPLLAAWRDWRLQAGNHARAFETLWRGLESLQSTPDRSPPRLFLENLLKWSWQAGVKRIVLLPDSSLAQLPWEALLRRWFPESGLTLERAVSLTHWRRAPPGEKGAGGSVLFGDDTQYPILHREQEANQARDYMKNTLNLEPVRYEDAKDLTVFDVLRSLQGSHAAYCVMHGHYDPSEPRNSALTLYRDAQREDKLYCWALAAIPNRNRFLALSACESALCGSTAETLLAPVGIGQTLIAAGARQVLGTLWPVNQDASWLFHHFLYQAAGHHRKNELLPKVAWNDLIAVAQQRMRELTADEAINLIPGFNNRINGHIPAPDDDSIELKYPFRHPYYWAPFVMLGEPGLPKPVNEA